MNSVTQSIKNTKESIVQKAGEVVDRVREGGNSVIEGGKRAADSVSSTVSNGASSVIVTIVFYPFFILFPQNLKEYIYIYI